MIITMRELHLIDTIKPRPAAGFFVCGMMGRFEYD